MFKGISSSFSRSFSSSSQTSKSKSKFLKGALEKLPCKVIEKRIVNNDSIFYRLELPHKEMELGLPPAKHIQINVKLDEEKWGKRSYTPVTHPEQPGFCDLLVKVYQPNEKYPTGGVISRKIAEIEEGQEMLISGPVGKV